MATSNHQNGDDCLPYPIRRMRQSSPVGRSVVDYSCEADLQSALAAVSIVDWRLQVPDSEAEPEDVHIELKRLWTLKSYLLLDADKEEAFDRLTQEARTFYHVPTSLISLIDLGRQFFLSNTGNPGDVRESPRSVAFCSHTILNKNGILVVNDTFLDERFCHNPLVTTSPYLRFYAGAPLISPEGYRLGTFCVEGPEPRPEGLSEEELDKLLAYADQAMQLMVQRRQVLQERLRGPIQENLKRHAAVTTNLGGLLYKFGECLAAMKLFQESVQTLMYLEEEGGGGLPSSDRQEEMVQLYGLLASEQNTPESRDALFKRARFISGAESMEYSGAGVPFAQTICRTCVIDGIPGLFSAISRLKGPAARRHQTGLVFAEAFQISLEDQKGVDYRNFIIPLDQCSKATLFNMGLIHYHWGSADSAMQFFDLAASLSQAHTPLEFDPVVLGCLNNMAQIHLQYGRPNDAMEMLADALTRGNAALAAMYTNDDPMRPDALSILEQEDFKSRRLRRKLARTVMNMGRVHFFNSDYNASMSTCKDAMKLLHTTNFEDSEAAAAWFNIAILLHHQGNRIESLVYLDKFINRALELVGRTYQVAEALHRKGQILYEMGNLYECMKPLNEALSIRRDTLGSKHLDVAESLSTIGTVLVAREEYDFALNALEGGLSIMKSNGGGAGSELSLESAQTMLEVGRAHHIQGNLEASMKVYEEVADVARRFFGERHPFVARIFNILGNLHLEVGEIDESIRLFAEAMKMHLEQGLPVDYDVVQDPLLGCKLQKNQAAPTA